MTTRDFSLVRRRKNLIDLITPKRAGVKGYRLQAATNFDASYTTIITADISSGYLDSNVNSAKLHSINNPDHIRIVFDPNTFTGTAGIVDTKHFWLRFVPVDYSGASGTAGNGVVVITDSEHMGNCRVQIAGVAPNQASVANSLQIDLPFLTQDIYVKNEDPTSGGQDLYIAFIPGGPEQQIGPQQVSQVFEGPIDTLLVRGSSGTVNFSASFASYLPL